MAPHSLGDVRADDRTTAEIADALFLKAEVPFRTGHHFASELTDYGRGKGLKLQEIPFTEVVRIYEEQAEAKLPLSEKEFREVISAEYMVFGRKGLGRPQAHESTRLLTDQRAEINSIATLQTAQWNTQERSQIIHEKKFIILIR